MGVSYQIEMNRSILFRLFFALACVSQCSAECNCSRGTHCYMGECRTGKEIAQMAFDAGKPCKYKSDCKEMCSQVLDNSQGKCSPYLRMGRLPPARHEDECDQDGDCGGEGSCIATLRGRECT